MDENQLFTLLPQSIGIMANLLILGAAIYAIATQSSVATGLLLFGAIARTVCSLYYTVGIQLLDNDYERFTTFGIPFSILAYLGSIAFIVGFFMFAYKLFTTTTKV